MSYTIKATAPTSYQISSLREFGMPIRSLGDGSHIASAEFETEEEAQQYLRNRADQYNDQDPEGSAERLADMYGDIKRAGSLQLDAVRAYIQEVEE
jgi:hypothetical protein